MTQGVCYFLCGGGRRAKWRRYLSMMTVSLHSLRKWYRGDVRVLIGHDVEWNEVLELALGTLIKRVPITPVPKHAGYVTKASLWRHSPFERTILLDADTVVTGDIDELFFPSIGVTKFSTWNTHGKIVGGRLRQWNAIEGYSGLVTRATDSIWPSS